MAKKTRVLFVSSESGPYSATGGLADVSQALPISLVKSGIIVNKVIPKYKGVEDKFEIKKKFSFIMDIAGRSEKVDIYHAKENGVNIYLVASGRYFERDNMYGYEDDGERFGFFAKAVLQMNMILGFKPDIIHLNDWQTGMISLLLKTEYATMEFYRGIKVLYTIHNLQYQGVFNKYILHALGLSDRYFNQEEIEYYGNVCFMKAGIVYSDLVSTVSETYAKEIQTEDFGYGLEGILMKYSHKIKGILNGIYYENYDPAVDEEIEHNYTDKNFEVEKLNQKNAFKKDIGLNAGDKALVGVVSRLVEQKGIDLVVSAIEKFAPLGLQFVILGSGEEKYEKSLRKLAKKYKGDVVANITYDSEYAKRVYASSDFFLMPSLFEPCGLSQLYSLRYGALPIVRNTGGLSDTIVDYSQDKRRGTGFVFDDFNAKSFNKSIEDAIELYEDKDALKKVVKRAMGVRFSWEESATSYSKLYDSMLGKKR